MCCCTSCERSAGDAGPSASTPPGATTETCATCSVSLTPKPLTLCGAGKTAAVAANGTPAGGGFAWTSSDAGVATVAGSGSTATVTAVAAGTATITVTFSPSGCGPCSDRVSVKVCTCTPGRKYAYAAKSVSHVTGVRAKIKTRYGKLCCEDEGCNTDAAYNVVFVSIANQSGGTSMWGQAGYGRERNAGSTAIKRYRYAEMNGATYKVNYDTAHAPAEGSVHTYQCELTKSTGTLTYSFDGSAWQTFADTGWKNTTANSTKAVEEIYNKEDDMAGTTADKCQVTEWQYREDGKAYTDVGITTGDLVNSDAAEWGIERVSGTAVNIWDKKPLP